MKPATAAILAGFGVAALAGVVWALTRPKPLGNPKPSPTDELLPDLGLAPDPGQSPSDDEQPGEQPVEPPGEQPGEQPVEPPVEPPGEPPEGGGIQSPGLGLGAAMGSKLVGILSRLQYNGSWCHAAFIPKATLNYEGTVRDVAGDGLVWGWQQPGSQPPAQNASVKYGTRLIVAIEPMSNTSAGWADDGFANLGHAEVLASRVAGVISSGVVPVTLRAVLAAFADKQLPGYPVVTAAGASPRGHLKKCLASWAALGFTRIVPILNVASGESNLRALIEECAILGVDYMLMSWQSIQEEGVKCEILKKVKP